MKLVKRLASEDRQQALSFTFDSRQLRRLGGMAEPIEPRSGAHPSAIEVEAKDR